MFGPWYAKSGLRFRCTRCGACCRRPGTVSLTAAEADRIAARIVGEGATASSLAGELWLENVDGSWLIDVPDDAACPLLGPTGCTVHDIKPMQCATYPFWPEIVKSRRTWREEAPWCEGIRDDGDVYDAPAIADLLAESARTREGDGEGGAGAS